MSSDLGITPGLVERMDLADYIQRARQERLRVIRDLFGFGFAVAKDAVEKAASSVTADAPEARTPVCGR
jgi:hypothetical protein